MRLALSVLALVLFAAEARAEAVPRTLIALYDSREESSPRTTLIHRYLEMPANYLGYDVRYYDVNAALPVPGEDVRGIVIWFNGGAEVPDAGAYLDWLEEATARGVHLVVMENFGLGDRWRRDPVMMEKAAHVLERIGVKDTNRWQSLTYEVKIAENDRMLTGFERAYEASLPPYMDTRAVGEGVTHLQLSLAQGRDTARSDLIIVSKQGGYAASGYAMYRVVENNEIKLSQWYIDPFAFLSAALGQEDAPKPDVTTLDGNRIFFATLDGDGWNDLSAMPAYRRAQATSAEVVQKEVLEKNPDLPFTLGIVTAELDPECYGLKTSAGVARAMLALPNVEAASHTKTHPLYWRFFADYSPAKEAPFRALYPPRPRDASSLLYTVMDKFMGKWKAWEGASAHYPVPAPGRYDVSEEIALRKYYRTPREYACAPFELSQEINGAADEVRALLPADKTLRLLDWTGDTRPFEAAIAMAREAGLLNLGGGEARLNAAYPSYASLPPVGVHVGAETQIYAENGNEQGLLGDASEEHALGLNLFRQQAELGDLPLRATPLSLYAHVYAGRDAADLHVLSDALAYIRTQETLPVFASDYAAIANGFYAARIEALSQKSWRILSRGALNTLRFDHAALKTVDFAQSSGVMGMRWQDGHLYVALDPEAENPMVTLKGLETLGEYPSSAQSYLIGSNWQIKHLQTTNNSLTFEARGMGDAKMQWRMKTPGNYRVQLSQGGHILADQVSDAPKGILKIYLEHVSAIGPVIFSIVRQDND